MVGVSPQNPIVLISTNKTHLSIQSTLIEKCDLNDPPSPSNEGLPTSHPHSPSIISEQPIHPTCTSGLNAAQASQIPVMAHLEHHGLMQLDLPVSPLSGADPDDHPSQPYPPHTSPPVQNVPFGRPCVPWQKKATFDDCAFLQSYDDVFSYIDITMTHFWAFCLFE